MKFIVAYAITIAIGNLFLAPQHHKPPPHKHLTAEQIKQAKACALTRAEVQSSRKAVWYMQTIMRVQHTPTRYIENKLPCNAVGFLTWVRAHWKTQLRQVTINYENPPHKMQWLCIYSYENGGYGWTAHTGNGYYGGLQMDRSFQDTYAPKVLLRSKGTANNWTPLEQMWIAEYAAFSQGRGYYPWPRTAHYCGLI